ncbi:MAG: hypothetical protein EAZ92_14010 [Candidatus Kapaibacterium sp.]|nr:MAG: hypothetical protein EAZ92_14010 [Candidatus Kapabacteria bacterium]
MSNDPRIIELLSEMLIEQRQTNQRLEGVERELSGVKHEISELKHQQEITNIKQDAMIDELGRLRTALMKVAEGSSVSFEQIDDHERRIKALEARL